MNKMFYFSVLRDGQEYTVEALLNLYQGDCIGVLEILVYDAFGEQLKGVEAMMTADEDIVMYEWNIGQEFSEEGNFWEEYSNE